MVHTARQLVTKVLPFVLFGVFLLAFVGIPSYVYGGACDARYKSCIADGTNKQTCLTKWQKCLDPEKGGKCKTPSNVSQGGSCQKDDECLSYCTQATKDDGTIISCCQGGPKQEPGIKNNCTTKKGEECNPKQQELGKKPELKNPFKDLGKLLPPLGDRIGDCLLGFSLENCLGGGMPKPDLPDMSGPPPAQVRPDDPRRNPPFGGGGEIFMPPSRPEPPARVAPPETPRPTPPASPPTAPSSPPSTNSRPADTFGKPSSEGQDFPGNQASTPNNGFFRNGIAQFANLFRGFGNFFSI